MARVAPNGPASVHSCDTRAPSEYSAGKLPKAAGAGGGGGTYLEREGRHQSPRHARPLVTLHKRPGTSFALVFYYLVQRPVAEGGQGTHQTRGRGRAAGNSSPETAT
jgi:hypothetical protein